MKPLIGLGVDYTHNYGCNLTELIERLPSGISHLSVVGLPNIEQAKKLRQTFSRLPIIHHFAGMEPAGIEGLNLDVLDTQNTISQALGAVWCLEDIGIWNIGPYKLPYFSAPVLCQEVLDMAIEGVKKIQQVSSIPFSAEVPSFSFLAGDMALGDFFHQLVNATQCNVVLDISHVYSYAIYKDSSPIEVLNSLPLMAVNEIHIAGGSVHPIHEWRYRDTHSENIVEEIFPLLELALAKCPGIKAVTYELGVGISEEIIVKDLKNINDSCQKMHFAPSVS